MRKLALALLIAATPAAAQSVGDQIYQVSFQSVTFTCGSIEHNGQAQRLLHATHKINLPVYEPAPNDPAARQWSIVYRIICERGSLQEAKPSKIRQVNNDTIHRRF
jgi:hypothetical protein